MTEQGMMSAGQMQHLRCIGTTSYTEHVVNLGLSPDASMEIDELRRLIFLAVGHIDAQAEKIKECEAENAKLREENKYVPRLKSGEVAMEGQDVWAIEYGTDIVMMTCFGSRAYDKGGVARANVEDCYATYEQAKEAAKEKTPANKTALELQNYSIRVSGTEAKTAEKEKQ